MKQLYTLIFLFVISISVAQEKDAYNRMFFKEIQKMESEIFNYETRDFIVNEYDKIIEKTSDTELIEMIENRKEAIKDINLKTYKSKGLENIDPKFMRYFRTKEDKFTKATSINIRRMSIAPSAMYLSMYIDKNNELSLFLNFSYDGSRWVFFDRVNALINDENYLFKVESSVREVRTGSNVYEWGRILVGDGELKILRELSATDEKVLVRFSGEKTEDRRLLKKQVEDIKQMLELFDLLKED